MFESQTKNKLGNTEIRTVLVNTVREELHHGESRGRGGGVGASERVIDPVR